MDYNLLFSIIAIVLSIFNTICLIINFLLSKAPILEYFFLESKRPNEVGFFLRNTGKLKGRLKELTFFDAINEKEISILFDMKQQILYPQQRTHRDFYFKYDFCKQKESKYIELSFKATLTLKILCFSKKYIFPRIIAEECKKTKLHNYAFFSP